jgi:2,4-dienoyl-CoA reductase-like NADH-dependent reductase (Old Yellow Enzyme family)
VPIINKEVWQSWVDANPDDYGGCCVNVARQVMAILDAEPGAIDPHAIITRADKEVKAGGITGFMAAVVAQMVAGCHSRGEEFRRAWNADYGEQGERANDEGTLINPAIVTISV